MGFVDATPACMGSYDRMDAVKTPKGCNSIAQGGHDATLGTGENKDTADRTSAEKSQEAKTDPMSVSCDLRREASHPESLPPSPSWLRRTSNHRKREMYAALL